MFFQLRAAVVLLAVFTLLTGVAYPLVVTGIAQLLFPHQANGSQIMVEGRVVGSEHIGQQFTRPEFFWGRLSATSPVAYNSAASSGSNFGPLNPARKAAAEARLNDLRRVGGATDNVPVDLVTASASGLDPEISPAAAEFQIARVAKARNLPESQVRLLVRESTRGRLLGVLGEPRVRVLQLNLALERVTAQPAAPSK